MRIVVDTNIVFSAVLNTNTKIARILMKPRTSLNFYSTAQLAFELNEHRDKLKKLSGYSDSELDRVITLVTKRIRFINIEFIPLDKYDYAEILTQDIDIDDTEFVALTEHIKGKLWSGDRKLTNGLLKKGWNKVINTDELYEID